ncbi:MAG: TonB-dependent hemoglobin/transferrin/lactoferrin family receptor [Pseudomonas sp.]
MKTPLSLLALAIASSLAGQAHAESTPADPADQTLDTLHVIEQRQKSTNQNVKVLTTKDLEADGTQRMDDLTRYVPGVETVSLGGRFGSNGFNIRGLEADKVALTLDGISFPETLDSGTYQPYEFFRSGRGSVEMETVKSVEIIKGADSISAGSGALGGAVMFTTKDPADFLKREGNDSYAAFKYGYTGINDENMGSLTFANRTGQWETLAIYTKRKGHETESWYDSTDADTGANRRTPDPQDKETDSLLAKLNFLATDTQTIGVVYERTDNSVYTDNKSRSDGSGSYYKRTGDDESNRQRYGLNYRWHAENALFDNLEATVDHQKNYIQGDTNILVASGTYNSTSCSTDALCKRQEHRYNTQKTDRVAIDLDKSFELFGRRHALVYGAAWYKRTVDWNSIDTRWDNTGTQYSRETDASLWPDTAETSYTAYARDQFRLTERLGITAGVRYDSYKYVPTLTDTSDGSSGFTDDTGSVVKGDFSSPTWNLGADFKLTDTQSLWTQVGRGFRAPSVADMYGSTSTTEVTRTSDGATVEVPSSKSNPNLKAERSLNLELGWHWQSERLRLGLSVFRDKYSNFIESATFSADEDVEYSTTSRGQTTTSNGYSYTMPVNRGEVTVKGVEAEGLWLINANWMARLAYTYNQGKDDEGDALASISPAKAVLGVNYKAPSDRWNATVNITHQQRKNPDDYGTSVTNSSYGSETTSPYAYLAREYTIFDVFGTYNISRKIRLTAGVYNVFNKEYYLWNTIRTIGSGSSVWQGNTSQAGVGRWSQPGRNLRLTLTYEFL